MEWIAVHALQIVIFLEILTSSFDIYVKKRQLDKFNEEEIPKFYEEIKSRNKGNEIVS